MKSRAEAAQREVGGEILRGLSLQPRRLPYQPPFDAVTLLSYLGRRALPGVEEVVDGRYRRTISLPDTRGIIELEPLSDAVLLRFSLDNDDDIDAIVQRCRHLFDLDADPTAIAAVLGADPLLEPLVARRPGLRVPGTFDGFELAVRAILGQQVSVVGARTLAGRLAAALGDRLLHHHARWAIRMPVPSPTLGCAAPSRTRVWPAV